MTTGATWGPAILVVEDDPLIGELVTLRFTTAGFTTTWVRDGREALTRVYDLKPKLILLDLGLPGLDGFGVLVELRSRPQFAKVPVIVMTARNSAPEVQKAISLGANDYIAKPLDPAKLMARVQRILRPRATGELKQSPSDIWIVE